MPISLKQRFNGQANEVVEHCKVWGRLRTMEKYGVKDYLAFSKFIEAETNNPNFGINPLLSNSGDDSWGDPLLDAILTRFRKMEEKERVLTEQLNRARAEVDYYKAQRALAMEPKNNQIMQICKE